MLLICSKMKSDEVWLANDVFRIAIKLVTSQNLELRGVDQIEHWHKPPALSLKAYCYRRVRNYGNLYISKT